MDLPSEPPEDLRPFLEDWVSCIGESPYHVRSGANESRRRIFDWNRLNAILNYQRLDFPRLRVVQRERIRGDIDVTRRVDDTRGRTPSQVDVARMYYQMNQGGTLSLTSIGESDPDLRHFCDAMQELFGVSVNINVYASSKPERGFALHWDTHDVLVIQIDGHKRWRVFEQTRRFPLRRDIEPNDYPPDQISLEMLLEPGDLLYIPRGWWHDAVAIGEPSLHLTVGLRWRTGIDYLRWLVDRMLDYEVVRRDIHWGANEKHARFESIRELLLMTLDSESGSIEVFERESKAAIQVSPAGSLPYGIDGVALPGSAYVRSNCSGLASISLLVDEVVCQMDDKSLSMSIRGRDLLQHLLYSTNAIQIAELRQLHSDELTEDEINYLVSYLIALGLICVESGPE